MTFVELIEESECLYRGDGSREQSIAAAEEALSVAFAAEYRDYLKKASVVGINGHQITGLSATPETHVINATEKGREIIADIDSGWYVVEMANIDGIVVWQNSEGEIIQTSPTSSPKVIAKSLSEYVTH